MGLTDLVHSIPFAAPIFSSSRTPVVTLSSSPSVIASSSMTTYISAPSSASSTSNSFLTLSTSVSSSAFPISSTTLFEASKPTTPLGAPTVVSSSAVPSTCIDPAFVPPAGSNCFKVIGHGYPTIEGRYLRKIQGYASPSFDWPNTSPSIFYLDGAGTMYEAGQGTLMATDRTGGGAWMQFTELRFLGSQTKAVCTKDASTKSLTCFQTSTSYLGIATNYPPEDSRRTMPMFGAQFGFTQITLTYEEVACPALCNKAIETPTPTPVVVPTSSTQCLSPVATEAPAGSVCFTLIGHGPAHVEGQPLGMKSGYGNPTLGWSGYTPAVFYKDSNNWIYIASAEQNGQVMSSYSPVEVDSPWMQFNPPTTNNMKATGIFFPDKTFVFSLGSVVGTVVAPSKDYYSADDSRSATPLFARTGGTWAKLTFTFTEVQCPAKCAQGGGPSSSVQASSTWSLAVPPSMSSSVTSSTSMAASATSTVAVTTSTTSANPQPSSEAETTMTPCDGLGSGTKNFLGFDYTIFCGATGSSPATEIDVRYLPSFAACINYCTGLSVCKAVMFQEIAPKKNNYKCTRYSVLGVPGMGLDWKGTFDVAYRVDEV